MSLRVRAWLALILLVAFPVVSLLLVVGLLAFGVWLATVVPQLGGWLIVAVLPLLWPVLHGVRHGIWHRRPHRADGVELAREDHPDLWREVDAVTRAMREAPMSRVVVDATANAAVSVWRHQRELIIGLPLLAALSTGQLRAVLAHEIGHVASGHTRAAGRTYRAGVALERTGDAMHHPLGRRFVQAYQGVYLRVAMPVMRAHEVRADQWSAAVAGGLTAAEALAAVARVSVAWDVMGNDYWPAVADGSRTPSAVQGLLQLLQGPAAEFIREAADRVLAAPAGPYDSHPSSQQRITLLQRARVPSGRPGDEAPATSLLAGGSAQPLERGLGLCSADIDWDEAIAEARAGRAAARCGQVIAQMTQINPGGATTLRALLEAVAEGHGPQLVQPFLRGDIPARFRQEATSQAISMAMQDVALHLLSRRHQVRIGAAWDGAVVNVQVIAPDGNVVAWPSALFEAVATASERWTQEQAVRQLSSQLVNLGVEVDLLLDAADEPFPASIPAAALTVTLPSPRYPEQRKDQAYDLIAFDDGLLLVFVPTRERGVSAGLRRTLGASNKRQLDRVQRTLHDVNGRPANYADNEGKAARWTLTRT